MTHARGDIESPGHHPSGPSDPRGGAVRGPEGEQNPVRVILVGRTGMDQRLRRESGVELVRVRDALEAIGELAEPFDGAGVVVLVGPDSEPRETAEALGQWVSALRHVDPGVRVLRIATDRDQGPGDAYDGLVNPAGTVDQVLRIADGMSPTPRASSGGAAPDDDGPVCELSQEPDPWDQQAAAEVGDTAVLEAMIQGRDPLDPAMELIRRRCGASVEFLPETREHASCAKGDTVPGVPVQWRGKRFGWLRGASAIDDALLRGHAAWLAGWIRLGAQQRELRLGAFSDPLTGAWNRRYFDRYLRSAIERAAARRGSVTVMVFDIDDFKRYNDRYGHAAGDEILVETVRLLGSLVRPSDRVCRVGGDEFAVVFDDPGGPREPGSRPPATIWQISKRFQDEICRHHFPKLGTEAPGTLTISGGLATYPWDGRTAEELVEHADALAIQSKQTGKNAITFGPGASRVCGTESGVDRATDPDSHGSD